MLDARTVVVRAGKIAEVLPGAVDAPRITSYNVCYTKLLRILTAHRAEGMGQDVLEVEVFQAVQDARIGAVDVFSYNFV